MTNDLSFKYLFTSCNIQAGSFSYDPDGSSVWLTIPYEPRIEAGDYIKIAHDPGVEPHDGALSMIDYQVLLISETEGHMLQINAVPLTTADTVASDSAHGADAVELMAEGAANGLLKTLEKPGAGLLRASICPIATDADRDLAQACREWIKGCICAPAARPQDCPECTAAFLDAVLKRAQAHGLTIGSNALKSRTDPLR